MIKRTFDFSSLLSSQVRAIIEADAESAATTADFIEKVGFEKDRNSKGMGKLRMVEFTMQRRNDEGGLSTHHVKIPLLSLIPIPMLNIERAEINFDLQIEEIQENTTEDANAKNLRGRQASRLRTSFARKTPANRKSSGSTTHQADLSVKLTMSQSDFPLGIERLLNIAELGANDEIE
ncbi:DUF2589 domain-containing protein [Paraneptunicella aestuarii]|uniref:DUF2589 domain-containing protein n=1 Tax=Paraneptunicella aestuarii TaxID=2831148 RepID=UPI001E5C754E|nr:DUF2589 domain-containing protein [Paraneptunicella aestuarii]UAA37539.1 DUF2589 domain-containing protein [Paraneptunicella aestuarii]